MSRRETREKKEKIFYTITLFKTLNLNIEDIKNCDVIIFQPLDENHGVYSTNNILKLIKESCIKNKFSICV